MTAVLTQRTALPALFALMLGAFAIGTTEFVAIGILPGVAADLRLTLPAAGWMVGIYALGVVVGGPLLTALTGRVPRKWLLVGAMALFTLANAVVALSASYALLLAARGVGAFAHGVFFGIGASVAAGLVPPERRAAAIAMVFSGLTLAVATSVPLGTFLGQALGWRATFWAVAGLGLLSALAMAGLLPGSIATTRPGSLREQARVLGSGRLLMAFGMNVFGYGGTFVAFTYLAAILEQVTGFGPERVSQLLVLYGVSVIAGNAIGGRLVDRDPLPVLAVMFTLQAAVLAAFGFTAASAPGTVATLALMGALSFCNVPGLHLYVLQLARRYRPGAIDTASAINISAANLGIALAALVGGRVVDSPLGLAATPWVGACVVMVALGLTLWSGWLDRRHPPGESSLPDDATGP
ncbi:MFS transporter [Stenotrophomonas sp. MMGLT7]|uniref:MFS transporter n=1 Tax=Stenotrophomonas sp. MMGLT7 TaxID=2901227 RepID=UPI001E29EE04|nr:MFS transporter [Stenotrophomonas sp. MMGLT7]MCD7097333.1 MFS transporter [Stenotrophomonas sp. MMGLT7]